MAITDTVPHIKAEILVDNVALQEYEDDEERTSVGTVAKYIEVKSGAEFVIRYRFDQKPEHDVRVDFLLDGNYICGQVALLKDFRGGSLEHKSYGARSNEGGVWMLSKYAFSDLEIAMCSNFFVRTIAKSMDSRFD